MSAPVQPPKPPKTPMQRVAAVITTVLIIIGGLGLTAFIVLGLAIASCFLAH